MMLLVKQLCCTVCLLLAAFLVSMPQTSRAAKALKTSRLVFRMLDMSLCREKETAASGGNFTLRPVGKSVLVDGEFDFSRTAKTLNMLSFSITRCMEAVSFNTCEYYDTWKYRLGVCGMLMAKGMPWSAWAEKYHPSLDCPLKAGHYSFRDGGINPDSLDAFGMRLDNTLWIVTVQAYDESNQLFMCQNYTAEFKRVRV